MKKPIRLKLEEQETLIDWTEDSHEAEIQTFSPGLKRKLANFAKKCPELCRLIHDENEVGKGGVIYRVDRRRMCISFREPWSEEKLEANRQLWTEEKREAQRQRMRELRASQLKGK